MPQPEELGGLRDPELKTAKEGGKRREKVSEGRKKGALTLDGIQAWQEDERDRERGQGENHRTGHRGGSTATEGGVALRPLILGLPTSNQDAACGAVICVWAREAESG